jgi:predicted ATPase
MGNVSIEFFYMKNYRESGGDWIKVGNCLTYEGNREDVDKFSSDVDKRSFFNKYNTVESVNVLLGINGSGKTTALHGLARTIPYFADLLYGSSLIVKHGDDFKLIRNKNFIREVLIDERRLCELITDSVIDNEIKALLEDHSTFMIDTSFKNSSQYRPISMNNALDLTSSGLLYSDSSSDGFDGHGLDYEKHISKEFLRSVNLLGTRESRDVISNLGFVLPDGIQVMANRNVFEDLKTRITSYNQSILKTDLQRDFELHKRFSQQIELEATSQSDLQSGTKGLFKSVFFCMLASHITDRLSNPIFQNEYYLILRKYFEDFNYDDFEDLIGKLCSFELMGSKLRDKYKAFQSLCDFLGEYERVSESFLVTLSNNQTEIEKMVNLVSCMYEYSPPVKYEFRQMSSGEENIIKIFSRIYYGQKELQKFDKVTSRYLIILDEPDVSLHPEWERRLLKNILGFIEEMFKGSKVQIIISTNKPFILSDFTSENITVLGGMSRDGKSPFCNRISSILKNEFFLTNDLGLLAEEYLKSLSDRLDGLESNDNLYEKIGDDFLKKAVLGFINEKNKNK